jgi:hypothetical protein
VYSVAIAWLYVTILMAATETSVVGGLLTFFLYGLAPLLLFVYLFGRRRRSLRVREVADEPHAPDPEKDQ